VLPDDGDYTKTSWSCFNVSFNIILKQLFCASVGNKTLIILQKLEVTRMTEKDENQSVVVASYNIGLSAVDNIKKYKDQLQLLVVSCKSLKDLLRFQTLKQPK
jgi:hypothetical protein